MSAIDAEFGRCLSHIAGCRYGGLSCSLPKITTATIVCSSGVDKVDLEAVRSNAALSIRTSTRGKKQYRSFSNSVTVLFEGTKAIKVFINGKFHITGCPKVAKALEHANTLCGAMGWPAVEEGKVKILTLNVSFGVQPRRNIDLSRFHAYILACEPSSVGARYNPDIYQGLVLKVPVSNGRHASVLVFYTATAIITGVREPSDLLDAHSAFMTLLARADPFM